ncbi:ECF-type sigma factor [Erythrobacter sp. THAF29]|uniref:ECF-type sigma factor n=1 Tax=Erythrobacter sp. THAF29 TaxID=2587851 RepID=UPI0012A95503|nr:ECF-type sigma factor [Erythrobacter sp. THAF29]QFT78695.1 RNA polymerase sigma factor [Erythrobacter sp. THAF29]
MQIDEGLLRAIDPDLRRIAAARLSGERNCSLAAQDLVNEAFVRILKIDGVEELGRARVLALVSHVMRQVLIDHARRKQADKRSHQKVTLMTGMAEDPPLDLIALDLLLEDLAELDPQRAKLVEMRFFGGMTIEEIAEVTDLSPATVKRRWAATRAWLHTRLSPS